MSLSRDEGLAGDLSGGAAGGPPICTGVAAPRFVAGSGLAGLYPHLGSTRVNSIHHQAVKALGKDLVVEALSVPDAIIEAIRWNGPGYLVGVQWHPEFHDPANPELLDVGPLLREFLSEAAKTRSSAMQQATVQLV